MPEIADSKHLAAAEWSNGILTVKFQSGDVYEYYDVPVGIMNELMQSESKGQFFRNHIKGGFEYAKVNQKNG